jgi:hypothetical protein
MNRSLLWLTLAAGFLLGISIGLYLGGGLGVSGGQTDAGPVSTNSPDGPASTNSTEDLASEGKGAERVDSDARTDQSRPRTQLQNSVLEALSAEPPFDQVGLITLIQEMRKDDFPIMLEILSKAKTTLNMRSDNSQGPLVWVAFWQRFGEVDPTNAVAQALRYKDLSYKDRQFLEKQLFTGMARKHPMVAASLFQQNPELPNRERAAEGLILGWSAKNPQAALQWAEKNLEGDALNKGIYASTWGAGRGVKDRPDVTKAISLLNAVSDSNRHVAVRSIKDMIRQRPSVPVPEILEFFDTTRRLGVRDMAFEKEQARRCADMDPYAAAAFFAKELPNEESNDYAELRTTLTHWMQTDPKAVENWAKGQRDTTHYSVVEEVLATARSGKAGSQADR